MKRWLTNNVKWLVPFAGAAAAAVKPIVVGGDYSTPQLLFAASMVLSAYVAWVSPNVEAGVGKYTKALVVAAIAGVGAAQQVLPGGISRADVWTIGTAVVAAAGTFSLKTTQTRAVIASGYAQMGDQVPDPTGAVTEQEQPA